MKKAAAPASPVNLGTKRQCPKCAAKFYDFNKEDIVCPKCKAELDAAALSQPPKIAPEPKRSKAVPKDDDEDTPTGDAAFETVEDLTDDDDDVSEDIDVDADSDEDEF